MIYRNRVVNWKTIKKIIKVTLKPLIVSVVASLFWYAVFYDKNQHFRDGLEYIAAGAWMMLYVTIYSMFTAVIFSSVWEKYNRLRTAVKRLDSETFFDLADETMSPLVHFLMFIVSGLMLLAFMGLKYQDIGSGVLIVSSTAYIFALIYFVMAEIDDPCYSGNWRIKIPREWLEINPKEWRNERSKKAQREFQKKFYKLSNKKRKMLEKLLSKSPAL